MLRSCESDCSSEIGLKLRKLAHLQGTGQAAKGFLDERLVARRIYRMSHLWMELSEAQISKGARAMPML